MNEVPMIQHWGMVGTEETPKVTRVFGTLKNLTPFAALTLSFSLRVSSAT
jgi:hypothetical protein